MQDHERGVEQASEGAAPLLSPCEQPFGLAMQIRRTHLSSHGCMIVCAKGPRVGAWAIHKANVQTTLPLFMPCQVILGGSSLLQSMVDAVQLERTVASMSVAAKQVEQWPSFIYHGSQSD